jgi:signal transduction histidine kinase
MIFRTEDQEAFSNELRAAEASGQTGDERWHVRTNGSQFWAYGVMTCLRDSPGRIAGYVKILRDLTKQRLAQDERTRLMNELRRTNSVLKRMMATLAHDLRAPLTAILGWTRIIQSGSPQRAVDIEKALQSIERSGKRQLELIEELLDYSRLMAGAIEHTVETCRLKQILDDALDTVRPPALLKSIHIEQPVDCDPELVGNRIALTQVFTNLLSNAVKFTPNEGHIRIRCGRDTKWLHVAVTDTGKGIPPDLLSRIFEPFQPRNS